MALDTQEKRANAARVARPWMRAKYARGATNESSRIASGHGYGGNALSAGTFQVAWTHGSNAFIPRGSAMKKNVASQVIGVQMVSATDGSAFTGSATVVITGDGGTQGASGGTGPTHEGNGFHSYIPTQAETNYAHIGFTFTGSGAVPATVQVFTDFPQTGDTYSDWANGGRLDLLLDAIKAVTDVIPDSGALTTIGTDTARLTAARAGALTDWIDGGRLDLLLDAVKAVTDVIPDSGAMTTIGTDTARLTAVRAAVLTDLIDGGRLDLLIDAIKAVTDVIPDSGALTTIGTDTARLTAARAQVLDDWINAGRLDTILDTIAAFNNISTTDVNTAVLAGTNDIETGYSLKQAVRLIAAACTGILSGAATSSNVMKGLDETTTRITATVDADGNRSAVTYVKGS